MDETQNPPSGSGEEPQVPDAAQDVVETTQASGNVLSLASPLGDITNLEFFAF